MYPQLTRLLFTSLSLILAVSAGFAQKNLTAKANLQPSSTVATETDRVRDGLVGPVRRVRTEVVKLTNSAGKTVEDTKRVLLETSEYDLKGTKTQNEYFPITGSTLTGREVYKYDEKGNISEMTLMSADGSLVSKETYKYEYDSFGNWIKMTTSVAVVGNSKIEFEPTEVTYRAIFYYLDSNSARMLQPATPSGPVNSAPNNNAPATSPIKPSSSQQDSKRAATLPPSTSVAKLTATPVASAGVDLQSMNVAGNKKVEVTETDAPPSRSLLKPVSGGVLNGKAISLPTPAYPDMARRMGIFGTVEVNVIVDENGKVLSAKALSGPGPLRDTAVQAALRARFSPTKLSGQAVKVSGQINYKFSLP
jgi:TonB family protein